MFYVKHINSYIWKSWQRSRFAVLKKQFGNRSEFPSRWSREWAQRKVLSDKHDTADSRRGPSVPEIYGFSSKEAGKLTSSQFLKQARWDTHCISRKDVKAFHLRRARSGFLSVALWFMPCNAGIFIIKQSWHSTSSLGGTVDGCGRNFTLGCHS